MPTVLRRGPYRFFFYAGIGMSRLTCTWSGMTALPRFGSTLCGSTEAAASAGPS